MRWTSRFVCCAVLAVVAGLLTVAMASEEPKPPITPKVSTFAPAEDLSSQAQAYIQQIQNAVASEDDFKESKEGLAKDANTLVVIALALGLHDQDSKEKAIAPALLKAAQGVAAAAEEALKELPAGATKAQQDMAAAKSFSAAKKAVAGLTAAAEGTQKVQGELKWAKVASLEQLMKQVPLINTKLKRNVKGARLASQAKKTAGYSAAIAAIAQGSLFNTQEAKTPKQVAQWYAFAIELRDAAAAVNAGIHAQDAKKTAAGMTKLTQSCDDCHAVFHKAAANAADKDADK